MVQEIEHSHSQELEHLDVQISIKSAIKSIIKSMAWNGIAGTTSLCCWHTAAVIQTNDFIDMILIGYWTIVMRRMAVG